MIIVSYIFITKYNYVCSLCGAISKYNYFYIYTVGTNVIYQHDKTSGMFQVQVNLLFAPIMYNCKCMDVYAYISMWYTEI